MDALCINYVTQIGDGVSHKVAFTLVHSDAMVLQPTENFLQGLEVGLVCRTCEEDQYRE